MLLVNKYWAKSSSIYTNVILRPYLLLIGLNFFKLKILPCICHNSTVMVVESIANIKKGECQNKYQLCQPKKKIDRGKVLSTIILFLILFPLIFSQNKRIFICLITTLIYLFLISISSLKYKSINLPLFYSPFPPMLCLYGLVSFYHLLNNF